MARTNKVEVEIVATDEASPKIDRLEKKIDGLESDEARITVTADMGRTEAQLDAARKKLEGLDGDEATVQMRLIGTLEKDLEDAQKLFNQLDGKTGTVKLDVDAREAKRALAALEDEHVTIEVDADTSGAKQGIGDIGDAISNLDGPIGDIGGKLSALASPGGAALGLVGVLGAAAAQTAKVGTEVSELAVVLDTSTETASRLRAVFADANIEASDLSDIALQVTGALSAAPDMAERLGIGLEEAKNPANAIKAAIDGWDFLSATERSQLFGEEGVRQIGSIVASGQDLDDLLAGVEKRRVMSPEDVENARRMSAMVAELQGQIEALALTVGGPLVDAVAALDDAIAKIPGESGLFDFIGGAFETIFTPASSQLEDNRTAFGEAGTEAGNAYIRGIIESVAAMPADELAAPLDAIATATDQWAASNRDVNDMVRSMPKTWEIVTRAVGKLTQGQKASAEEQEAINTLVNTFGIDAGRVLDIARSQWEQHGATVDKTKIRYNQLATAAGDELAAAARRGLHELGPAILKKNADEALALELALSGVNSELSDMAENQDELESDSLAKALDLGDAPLDALTDIRNIDQGIRDLAEWVRTNGIPNIFDKDDVNADDFLNEIARLKGPIQEAIADAFAEGGTGAATALSQKFITQLASQSGLTATQVSTLLGLDNLEASIDVAINETSLAQAKRQLDLLVGVQGGYTPYTASIAMALDAEEITPENAQLLVQEALRGEGVTIPSGLAVPKFDNALARAQRDLDSRPVTVPVRVGNIPQSELNRILGMLAGTTPLNTPASTSTVNQTIIMPQSTPSQTNDNFNIFVSRNGIR